jgi:hypothetical protein
MLSCSETGTREGYRQTTPDAQIHPEAKPDGPFCFGMNWNETANLEVCKLLIVWWPGTELNRRRQPFQGCLSTKLSGSE